MDELQIKLKELETENQELKKENQELKTRLSKYTNPERYKKYYETHKNDILKNKKEVRSKQKINFHTYEYMTLEQLTKEISNLNNFTNNDLAKSYGLVINKIAWEDTSRTKNSCWGPNISDLTLVVNNTSMNMIRKPNFSDITCDLPCENFTVTINTNGTLKRIPLKEYIQNLSLYNEITGSLQNSLFIERDSNLLASAQCCMLPLGPEGEIEFCPKMYNYQNAVLVITSTTQGTSSVILSGKENLYFNRNGRKVKYLAKRLEQDRKERGVAVKGEMTNEEEDRNVIIIYQIPLKQSNAERRSSYFTGNLNSLSLCSNSSFGGSINVCGGTSIGGNLEILNEKCCFDGCFDDNYIITKKTKKKGVDNAMLRVSDKDFGEFPKLDSSKLIRDDRFPIRVTYQFYKVTDIPDLKEDDFIYISNKISNIYKKNQSSLVTNKTNRPTESIFPELNFPIGEPSLFTN